MSAAEKATERWFARLAEAIAPVEDLEDRASDLTELRSVVRYLRDEPRCTWVVPPGFTLDWSVAVDVVESPFPSDYIYVSPFCFDPW